MIATTLLIFGLSLLLVGGELVVRGASNIAAAIGMSKLMVGLTVVAFGTSAPELAICLDAVWLGKPEIALGNIVGSNIANILLILGLTALFFPIVVHRKIVQREVPIMIGVSLLFLLLTLDGILYPSDGTILLGTMGLFLFWQIRTEKNGVNSTNQRTSENGDSEVGKHNIQLSVCFVLAGFGCLWFGGKWMVQGASELATLLGVSKLVIGLTIVAIGSSAPEIVTALLAAKRGFPEMAVGSVLGSNIANLLLVGGATTALSSSIRVPKEAFEFDIPVMIVCSIACLPIFATGHRIDRWEGVLFLLSFVAFTTILFAKPFLDESFPSWNQLGWSIAIPLILATLLALVLHRFRKSKND